MTLVGTVGLALIAVSVVMVVGCLLVVILPRALRLRRVVEATEVLVDEYRQTMTAEVWTAREHALERAVLLKPARRVRRVLTHPLTIAVLESYARRRDRAHEAVHG